MGLRNIHGIIAAALLASCSPGEDEAPSTAAPELTEAPTIDPPPPPEPDWTEILRDELSTATAPDNRQLIAALTGDLDAAQDEGFVLLPASLSAREGLYTRTETAEALARMSEAAAADGVRLVVLSAFRSMGDQRRIWNNKWNGTTLVDGGALPETVPDPTERALKILEFSSMPGTSRHHWGTDIDFNNLNNEWFDTPEGARVYDWLSENAASYGFCQPYTQKGPDRPAGYEMEKWHWSYMPVASKFLAAYPKLVGYFELASFEGAEEASTLAVIRDYVGGIAPECITGWSPDQPNPE